MPQYHIIRINRTKAESVGLISSNSIRAAFAKFKRDFPKKLVAGWDYHFYPINHARIFEKRVGKWRINSFLGNHELKGYRERQRLRYEEYFKNKTPAPSTTQ